MSYRTVSIKLARPTAVKRQAIDQAMVRYTRAFQALLAACLRLTDNVLNTVVYNLVHSLLYAVCFAVLTAVLRFALRALNIAFRLPGLRQLNEAGGALVGLGKGALLAYVCAWILSWAGVLTEEMIRGSVLLGLTKGFPPGMQV